MDTINNLFFFFIFSRPSVSPDHALYTWASGRHVAAVTACSRPKIRLPAEIPCSELSLPPHHRESNCSQKLCRAATQIKRLFFFLIYFFSLRDLLLLDVFFTFSLFLQKGIRKSRHQFTVKREGTGKWLQIVVTGGRCRT